MDETSGMVRFPRPLLRELLAGAPTSYTIGSPNGARRVIGGGEQLAVAIVTDPWIVDYAAQQPRGRGSKISVVTRQSRSSSIS